MSCSIGNAYKTEHYKHVLQIDLNWLSFHTGEIVLPLYWLLGTSHYKIIGSIFWKKYQLFLALAPSPSQGRGIFYSLPLVCLPLDCLTLDCLTLGCLPLDCLPLDCLPLDLLALTASTACLDLMRVGLLCLLLFLCQKCSWFVQKQQQTLSAVAVSCQC